MKTKIIVFDIGKVLIDFSWEKPLKALIAEGSDSAQDVLKQITHHPLLKAYEIGSISTAEFVIKMSAELNVDTRFFEAQFNEIFIGEIIYMHEILAKLKQHYKLYALSNINELHYQFIINHYPNILKYFEQIFYSHIIGKRKPDVACFAYTDEHINPNKQEVIFLDDLPENIEAARLYGWHSIQVDVHKLWIQELEKSAGFNF